MATECHLLPVEFKYEDDTKILLPSTATTIQGIMALKKDNAVFFPTQEFSRQNCILYSLIFSNRTIKYSFLGQKIILINYNTMQEKHQYGLQMGTV